MENITHSLMGATLAELLVPRDATPAQRRVFVTVGIIAANLPDADLLYTSISPAPLGYLLHHRGQTHTLVGLVVQALLVGAACLLPVMRRWVGPARSRLLWLIGLALLSHLVLDSWNSYGVHPFWPLSGRWFYGDAIFIADPWLWTTMGVAAVLSMRTKRGGMLLGGALGLSMVLLARIGMIATGTLVALFAGGVTLAIMMQHWTPRRRAGVALALVAVYVMAMFGLRERVDARVRGSLATLTSSPVFDVILSPHGGNPLCWSAIAITVDEPHDEYTMRRGTSALGVGCGVDRPTVEWDAPVRRSITSLRDLARRSCAARAWLQFGRAPDLTADAIADFRYGGTGRGSSMPLDPRDDGSCPPNLPTWGMPRADLVNGTR